MIERRTLSISLTPELHAFISSMVQGGSYGNSSEVVRAGLRLLRREEADRRVASGLDLVKPEGAAELKRSS